LYSAWEVVHVGDEQVDVVGGGVVVVVAVVVGVGVAVVVGVVVVGAVVGVAVVVGAGVGVTVVVGVDVAVGVGVVVGVDVAVGVGWSVGVLHAGRFFLPHDRADKAELVELKVTASPTTSARASESRARPRTAVLDMREGSSLGDGGRGRTTLPPGLRRPQGSGLV
jgi:hypothetical protein